MLDQKQMEAMYAAVERRLGKFKLVDSEANGLRVAAYLRENNFRMSEENLYQAIVACKDSLKWAPGCGPKKRADTQDSSSPSRRNHANSADDFGKSEPIFRNAMIKMDHDRATTELRAVRGTIATHCGRTHSATYRQREELEKTLSDLLKQFPEDKLTLKQSAFIASQINVKRNSFPE